jgi:hypothetical protein
LAITAMEYMCFLSLRQQNLAPLNPRMLDFGESNWYGDVAVGQLRNDIERFVSDPGKRTEILNELKVAEDAGGPLLAYKLARICFKGVLGVSQYSAIDPLTPGSKYKFNLNDPVPLREQFDICLNAGTAEHVFNVYQFFKTVHELTAPGGLMIHNSPFSGWPDHGFYNFQPTFYFDLAVANNYTVMAMVFGALQPFKFVQIAKREDIGELTARKKIPPNAHLQVMLRKSADPVEFSAPMQGFYSGKLSPEMMKMWKELR